MNLLLLWVTIVTVTKGLIYDDFTDAPFAFAKGSLSKTAESPYSTTLRGRKKYLAGCSWNTVVKGLRVHGSCLPDR